MINWLIGIILFLALVQPSRDRAAAALCVAIPTIFHLMLFSDSVAIPSEYYYQIAATADLCSIMFLSKLLRITDFSFKLIQLSTVFFSVNFSGYLLYLTYQNPAIYNYASIALYVGIILALLKRDEIDGRHRRGSTLRGRFRYLFGNWGSGIFQPSVCKETIK